MTGNSYGYDETTTWLLDQLTGERVERYLAARGWEKQPADAAGPLKDLALYRDSVGGGREVAVPAAATYADYRRRMAEAVAAIADSETRSHYAVLGDLVAPGANAAAAARSRSPIVFGVLAVAALVAGTLVVWRLAWHRRESLGSGSQLLAAAVVGLAVASAALVLWWWLRRGSDVLPRDLEARSATLYGRYLAAVGTLLLIDALVTLVAIAVLTGAGQFAEAPSEGEAASATASSAPENTVHALILLLALAMAVLGALFYTANSLRKKRDRGVLFDENVFWGGLWFRLGEAVVFTAVLFLVLYEKETDALYHKLLPVAALLVGMFVTSGERLVYGVAQRLFASIAALLPLPPSHPQDSTPDAEPTPPRK